MMTTQTISPPLVRSPGGKGAQFYTSIFLDSRIDGILRASVDTPGAKTGETLLVDFTLADQKYQALNGGAHDRFNDAMSLVVTCQDQAEVDRLWDDRGRRPAGAVWLVEGQIWRLLADRAGRPAEDAQREG